MRLHRPLYAATLIGTSFLLCGCPNPNLYTTPRTLNPGDVQFQVAAEAFGASLQSTTTTTNADGTTSPQTTSVSVFTPTVPTIGVRVGVADGLELGARIANFDTLAGDAKIRLLKGTLDLAIDPGLQFIYLGSISTNDGQGNTSSTSVGIMYFHVPLLIGFNVSPNVSLIATPGFVYALATANESADSTTQQATLSTGVLGRLGLASTSGRARNSRSSPRSPS
ncbi:MAG: hypothetical protein ACLP1X_33405 [Polyangiaceae bacterium]|jgi:hypothetical protein